MGGKKNRKKSNLENHNAIDLNADVFVQKMIDIFKSAVSSDSSNGGNTLGAAGPNSQQHPVGNSTMVELAEKDNVVQVKPVGELLEEIRRKEIELKDKEIELLRKENEIMRNNATDTTSNRNQPQPLSFKDVEESLTKFSGDDEYSIEKWVTDVNESATCLGWSENQKTVYAKRLLIGTAKESLRMANGMDNWDNLIRFLRKEFPSVKNSALIHKRMADRRKKADESFTKYLIVMRELGGTGNLEDAAIIEYCINGIIDDEHNKAVLYGAGCIDEFKEKLNIYANIKLKAKKRDMPSNNPVNNPTRNTRHSAKHGSRCYNCGDKGHQGRQCENKSKGPKCFKCNEYGHVSPNCNKKEIPRNELSNNRKSLAIVEEGACLTVVAKKDLTLLSKTVKKVLLFGKEIYALVDSGSDINLMSMKKFQNVGINLRDDQILFNGAGAKGVSTKGKFEAQLDIDGEIYSTVIHVVEDGILPVDFILGLNQTNHYHTHTNQCYNEEVCR